MPSTHRSAEPFAETIQVGRQAIFDRELEVFAYELLYRDASGGCRITDGDQASSQTLLNAFMEIGLERLTGPYRAFVNLTRPFFVNQLPLPFDRERVVLEILEDIEVDNALLDGIAAMAEQGYTLAMDDYAFQPHLRPILPLVQYIKVEVSAHGMDELARRMPELRASGARLLAEKVETAEQFEQLKALGFDYFQGYFFARPSMVRSSRVNENSSMVVRLLARLNDPAVPMQEVVGLVSQDPGLSFKVLRYVNSAATGLRNEVDSIQRAVVLMGLARIRAWATLFAMAGLGGRPSEILNLGLLRANLCERLCRLCRFGSPEAAYTVGLLSILDAMLSRPIDELVGELPLPDEIKLAIVDQQGPLGRLLHTAVELEQNRWPRDICSEIEPADLIEAYAASSEAAFSAMQVLGHG